MAMQPETVGMTCDRCGVQFRGNPRSQPLGSAYCSIACEEGRSPLPVDDPRSDGYHLHLQGEPEALVGETVVAEGANYPVVVGYVFKYEDGRYIIEHENIEEQELTQLKYEDSVVLSQIKNGRWWVE